ncbi:MAG: sigma 54-interacting transcriptional regulator [Firmicutes bacterium]|nr:sigma 54-interacting transcriptional regulator [Bacillota bacterium]
MIIRDIDKYKSIYDKVDALIIVNEENMILYSAMINDDRTYISTKDVIGQNLYEMYPNLTEENSTHARVMKTGKPVINENQLIVERSGKAYVINTSTFPIEDNGRRIGTFDLSSSLTPKSKNDEKEDRNKLYVLDSIVTENEAMLSIKSKILKVSRNDSPVMVIGESGTGKELIVEAIHSMGSRREKPFISVNCAAIPDALMESTLFGTVKGSFTGAENRKGLFEIADGGTLFLDEINSMNIDLQAKLLKVVEEQKYMKLGGERYVDVDVRVISAVNVDPEEAIKNNSLRSDLFFRLGVVQFFVPPLRERKEDLKPLTEHFISYYNGRMNRQVIGVDEDVRRVFENYPWPGNVREFRNVMESAFNMAEGEYIALSDIPETLAVFSFTRGNTAFPEAGKSLTSMVNEYEKEIIQQTLRNSGSLSQASSMLKMTRQAVKYKIEKYGIDYKRLLKK